MFKVLLYIRVVRRKGCRVYSIGQDIQVNKLKAKVIRYSKRKLFLIFNVNKMISHVTVHFFPKNMFQSFW